MIQNPVKQNQMKNELEKEVWLLLDNQRFDTDLLKNAAALASLMKASLQGLFIEEENLKRAAEFSFSREISGWSAQEREITGEIIQRTLQSSARQNRRQLEMVARDNNIQCTFQVVQGERLSWIHENAKKPRILFITGKQIPANYYQNLHFCNFIKAPVVLLYNGSEASQAALKIALQMAKFTGCTVVILILADEETEKNALKTLVNESLSRVSDIAVTIQYANDKQLVESLHRLKASMLVLADDIKSEAGEIVLESVAQRRFRFPVILIQ